MGKYGDSNLIQPSGITADRAMEIALAALGAPPVEDVYEDMAEETPFIPEALDQLDERIIVLHKRGLNDTQIMAELPLTKLQIRTRRYRMGLVKNDTPLPVVKRTRKWWALMRATVTDMVLDGYTDRAIADELGLKVDWIRTVRKRDGLPLNPAQSSPRHQFRGAASFRANELLWELWKEGKDDDEIAAALGLKREAARIRRNRLGLASHRPAHRPMSPENELLLAQVRKAHAEGLTDRQTAEKLGCPIRKATDLRYRAGLPVNRAYAHRTL